MGINEAVEILNANKHRDRSDWKIGQHGITKAEPPLNYVYSEGEGDPEYELELDYTDWDDDRAPIRLMPPDALIIAQWYAAKDLPATCSQCGRGLGDSWCADCAGSADRARLADAREATKAEGTWAWALEQLEAARALTRRMFSGAPYIRLERGTFRMYHRASGMTTVWAASYEDIQATDWQIARE